MSTVPDSQASHQYPSQSLRYDASYPSRPLPNDTVRFNDDFASHEVAHIITRRSLTPTPIGYKSLEPQQKRPKLDDLVTFKQLEDPSYKEDTSKSIRSEIHDIARSSPIPINSKETSYSMGLSTPRPTPREQENTGEPSPSRRPKRLASIKGTILNIHSMIWLAKL